MKLITLALDPLAPETWETAEVENVLDFLMGQFTEWPHTARIYCGPVAIVNDVTPTTEAEVERLLALPGPFTVIVYPADPVTLIAAAVIGAVVVLAATPPSAPSVTVPNVSIRNTQSQSSNNELAERTNRARPNACIPDIYGQVRSTPDLIIAPYRKYVGHQEVEYAYMCVGRGVYDITDMRDGTTPVSQISGASAAVFAPYTSPNSGVAQMTIGPAITEPLYYTKRTDSVNGQLLRPSNQKRIAGRAGMLDLQFNTDTNIITRGVDSAAISFTDYFLTGESLRVSGAVSFTAAVTTATYTVMAANSTSITLRMPSSAIPAGFAVSMEFRLTTASLVPATGGAGVDVTGWYTVEAATMTANGPNWDLQLALVAPALSNSNWDKFGSGVAAGQSVTTARMPDGASVFRTLSGTFTIASVSDTEILLDNPDATVTGWGGTTWAPHLEAVIAVSGLRWVGPYTLPISDGNQILVNVVGPNGLYKDNGTTTVGTNITVQVYAEVLDAAGTKLLNEVAPGVFADLYQSNNVTVVGSGITLTQRAISSQISYSSLISLASGTPAFLRIKVARLFETDTAFSGTVVDEVRLKDLYSLSAASALHFGNITTVQTVTYATGGALAVKERKLNMLATSRLYLLDATGTYASTTTATKTAFDAILSVCYDPYIGRLTAAEVDYYQIKATLDSVVSYFGHAKVAEFCYTIDSNNLSFEEILSMIASSVFCTVYRRGNVVKLNFEKSTVNSTLLFNHRNKLPGSETRTIRFGNTDRHDGVTLRWVDPKDDAEVRYYIPADKSALNPKEVETVGVRNGLQAYFHAWRTWNRIRYQSMTTEFTATAEADLLVLKDRIMCADNTQALRNDGEVLAQSGLQLTLSQPWEAYEGPAPPTYTIFLQLYDGTVESMTVTPVTGDKYKAVLAQAPRLPLVLDADTYARTGYIITSPTSATRFNDMPFLVTEKEPQANMTTTVRAINYDARYYTNDDDYTTSVVNVDGVLL